MLGVRNDSKQLLDFLEAQIFGGAPFADILEKAPDLTLEQAYRLQFDLMKRRVAAGDPLIGYKAASTSRAMQAASGRGGPVVGSLLRSMFVPENRTITLTEGIRTAIEPEIAVILKRDLAGPGVGHAEVVAAVDAFLPAFELIQRSSTLKRSEQMALATNKLDGGIMLGSPATASYGIDLRLEGTVFSMDGVVNGSATAVEVLGDPLNAVAFIANKLGEYGESLKAGMILMTGSVVKAVEVGMDNRVVRADYTRLGSVTAHFSK